MRSGKGEVALFALMKMDDLTDKWTVILSAPWAKESDVGIFKYILNLIKSELSVEELPEIARVSIFPKTDHFVELLLKYKSGATITDQKLNGNQIHEGYILESNQGLDREIQQKLLIE